MALFGIRKPQVDSKFSPGIAREFFEIYDTATGEKKAEYVTDDSSLGASLACYQPGSFVFVGPTRKLGIMEIITAEPR